MLKFFFLKAAKDKFFILMLIGILIIPSAALLIGGSAVLPRAGFAVEGEADADASRLADYLSANGLVQFENRDVLTEAVDSSEIDAGLIIPGGLSQHLASGDTDGIIELVCTDRSLFPTLWKAHCSAALFSVLAPYIEAEAFDGAADYERVSELYYSMLDDGQLFVFDFKTAGGAPAEDVRARNAFLMLAGIVLFAVSFFGIGRVCAADYRLARKRLAPPESRVVLLLQLAVRTFTVMITACFGCMLVGNSDLMPRIALFVIVCAVLATLLSMLLSETLLTVYCSFMIILALAVCPVFVDLGMFIAPVRIIRLLVPVYWLFV